MRVGRSSRPEAGGGRRSRLRLRLRLFPLARLLRVRCVESERTLEEEENQREGGRSCLFFFILEMFCVWGGERTSEEEPEVGRRPCLFVRRGMAASFSLSWLFLSRSLFFSPETRKTSWTKGKKRHERLRLGLTLVVALHFISKRATKRAKRKQP